MFQEKAKRFDAELKEGRNNASSIELEFCAVAFFAIGKQAKTVEYLDKFTLIKLSCKSK